MTGMTLCIVPKRGAETDVSHVYVIYMNEILLVALGTNFLDCAIVL